MQMYFYEAQSSFYENVIREELLCKNSTHRPGSVVPRIESVLLHSSSKHCITDRRQFLNIALMLDTLGKQRPIATKTKVAHAEFKIRKGLPIGLKLTLRGAVKCYGFLMSRLLTVLFPRQNKAGSASSSVDEKQKETVIAGTHPTATEVEEVDRKKTQQQTRKQKNIPQHGIIARTNVSPKFTSPKQVALSLGNAMLAPELEAFSTHYIAGLEISIQTNISNTLDQLFLLSSLLLVIQI